MNLAGYSYHNAEPEHTCAYLWEPTLRILNLRVRPNARVLDLGCGAGAFAHALSAKGFDVTAIDPSVSGIELAKQAYPGVHFEIASTDEDLAARFGRFPVVISLEVVEHVFAPRQFAKCLFDLLQPGGTAIISTPYNGYWKNLAIALLGQCDQHFTALWDNGHIKFWSFATLTQLLREAGFQKIQFERAGRVPPIAKSMIAIAEKPK